MSSQSNQFSMQRNPACSKVFTAMPLSLEMFVLAGRVVECVVLALYNLCTLSSGSLP
jgi:hypothetical protein